MCVGNVNTLEFYGVALISQSLSNDNTTPKFTTYNHINRKVAYRHIDLKVLMNMR